MCCLFVNNCWATTPSQSPKYAALVVDQKTKKVLHQHNAKAKRYPASLVKVMTAYLMLEAIETGRFTMNQRLKVSKVAAAQQRLNLNLRAGETITVREALDGLIVHSANDAAVVIAEAVAGSEVNFAKRMTAKARQLGMTDTHFTNASGLPNPNQVTTAVDMVKLALATHQHFPQYSHLFTQTSFKFRGKVIAGHNKVMKNYPTATGMKTGYIASSGFNLITTTKSPTGNLVAVVFGGRTKEERDQKMMSLLNRAYADLSPKNKIHLAQKKPSEKIVQGVKKSKVIAAKAKKNKALKPVKQIASKANKQSKVVAPQRAAAAFEVVAERQDAFKILQQH